MMRKIFVSGIAVIFGFAVAVWFASPEPGQAASSETYRQLNLFGDVFERVRADYVEEVDDSELIESAIQGMLTALDPHSSYLNAKNYKDMQVQTRGEFGGLGIEVTMENGLVKVVTPIDDTPAQRAGIQSGDLVTHLDDEPILGLTLPQAVEKMRGRVDTEIKLTVSRKGAEKAIDIVIKRAVIKVQSVRARKEGKIAYLRITSFNEQTSSGVERTMKKIRDEIGPEFAGVVLDLRNNPGGLLDQAIAVSDAFLDRGEIVSTRGRTRDDTQRYNARKGDLAEGAPVIVLVNGGSASASEIVAGALQDHHRAVILGTRSFGKGSVQTIIPMQSSGALRLTTARYYTPAGRSIQALGIEPDILVEQASIEAVDTGKRRSEADLRNHLTEETDDKNPVKGEVKKPDAEIKDYQLARALDLLRGLAFFEPRREG